MKKMFLLVATLLLLSAALLTGCQSSSINLMDYVTVTFSGLDGQGSASCTLDTVALEKNSWVTRPVSLPKKPPKKWP